MFEFFQYRVTGCLECSVNLSIRQIYRYHSVGFVAAAVSMPIGGCRARRPVVDLSLVSAETVDVIVVAELAVL